MRRGVSNFSDRYSQAKNKYFKIYALKQESEHIMYQDAKNLYDYAMSNFFQPANLNEWNLKILA